MTARSHSVRQREQGYALLMVIFLVGLMIAASAVAIPDLLTQGKRQKEDLMIWRGEQYERGVKLYFGKTGNYPTQLDQITKDQNGIRFMRQAYKDPMNSEDGSWRLIYVTGAGQLIGSLNYQTLQQMAAILHPIASSGTAPGAPAAGQPGSPGGLFGGSAPIGGGAAGSTQSGAFGSGPQAPGSGAPTNGTGEIGGAGTGGIGTAGGGTGTGTGTGTDSNTDEDANTGPVVGGNITGVASTVNKPSLKVYQKATKYKKWEFIWNPLLDVAGGAGGAGAATGAGGTTTPGAPGIGQPGQGQTPGGSGGTPPQGAPPSAQPNGPPPGGGS